jgi:hypothetical protein
MPANEAEGVAVHFFPTVMLFPALEPRASASGHADDGRDAAGGAGGAEPLAAAVSGRVEKVPVVFTAANRTLDALEAFISSHRATQPPAPLDGQDAGGGAAPDVRAGEPLRQAVTTADGLARATIAG